MADVTTLKIEHPILSFETWQVAFERDPIGRQQAGVLAYRVTQPVDDPKYVLIDLDFGTREQAQAFLLRLEEVWSRRELSPGLARAAEPREQVHPRARVVREIERRAY